MINAFGKKLRILVHECRVAGIGNEAQLKKDRGHGRFAQDIESASDKGATVAKAGNSSHAFQNIVGKVLSSRRGGIDKRFASRGGTACSGIGMNTEKIVRTPCVGVGHTRAEAFVVGIAELSLGRGTGQAHIKVAVLPQKIGQKYPHTVDDVLLAQAVAFGSCVGIARVVSLVYVKFDCHKVPLSFFIKICYGSFFGEKEMEMSFSEEKNKIEKGTLYLVATPIGNLADLSERAVKVLSEVDFVAAEDTRNSMRLLSYLGISKPMISYFEHNKRERGEEIAARLQGGESCALVTDAGTPAVSDPGEDMVALCAERGIPVCSVPGPCAAIVALTLSGLPTGRFTFEGFLSANKAERKKQLTALDGERRTMIFHEAPHKLRTTLADLCKTFGDERRISLCRELTKKNEEVLRLTLRTAVAYYEENEPRGEYVLVMEGATEVIAEDWSNVSVQDHVAQYIASGMSKMDAIKAVAKERGVPKNEIYKQVL